MSIVTKNGDKGQTGLFGGQRVSKASPRLHAYGTVDELNALLGVVLAEFATEADAGEIRERLLLTQHELFRMGADLATPLGEHAPKVPRIETRHVENLDQWVARLESRLPAQQTFLLPSGSLLAAHLHLARTVCRRAERWTVALGEHEPVNPEAIVYLNRLSDLLFLLARAANCISNTPEVPVSYEKSPEAVKTA